MLAKEEMGKKLELARIEKEMSQVELAQEIGLSQGMIGKYERGINRIPPDILQKISRVLEKPVAYFYGEEESLDTIRELLKDFVRDGDPKYKFASQGNEIPLLDEIYSTNILDQIAVARNKYTISVNLLDERDTCFAIKTSNLSTIDLDVAVDTTLIISTTISPINGDKVILFHGDDVLVRSYYKKGDNIEYRTSNPMFPQTIAKSDDYKLVGVVIGIEKRV